MSILTSVTIQRGASQTNRAGGTTIATGVSVQIDEKDPMLAVEYDKAHPSDVFDGYIDMLPSNTQLLRGDAWIDQDNTDPITGLAVYYQVVSRPEPFPDGHTECVLHLYEGNA